MDSWVGGVNPSHPARYWLSLGQNPLHQLVCIINGQYTWEGSLPTHSPTVYLR